MITDVGGWSEELKIGEHKDLFLRLKATGKKVVSCPGIEVYNWKPYHKSELNSQHYYARRYGKRFGSECYTLLAHFSCSLITASLSDFICPPSSMYYICHRIT